jgi:ATP-dependent RNA helicase DOB1
VAEFERLKREINEAAEVMMSEMLRPERCLRFMRPGRLVRVRVAGADYGWGVVCGVVRKAGGGGGAAPPAADGAAAAPEPTASYVLDVLLRVIMPGGSGGAPRPSPDGIAGELGVVPVSLACVSLLSALMVQLPEDLRAPDARAAVGLALAELHRRFPAGLPRLDPIEDMGIDDARFVDAVRTVEALEPQLLAHPLFGPSAEAQRYGVGGGAAAAADGATAAARKEAFDRKAELKREASKARDVGSSAMRTLGCWESANRV